VPSRPLHPPPPLPPARLPRPPSHQCHRHRTSWFNGHGCSPDRSAQHTQASARRNVHDRSLRGVETRSHPVLRSDDEGSDIRLASQTPPSITDTERALLLRPRHTLPLLGSDRECEWVVAAAAAATAAAWWGGGGSCDGGGDGGGGGGGGGCGRVGWWWWQWSLPPSPPHWWWWYPRPGARFRRSLRHRLHHPPPQPLRPSPPPPPPPTSPK
jgi:hypothetical protein